MKTIRFDAADERLFDVAAAAGEWAVPGVVAGAHLDPREAQGKARQAFATRECMSTISSSASISWPPSVVTLCSRKNDAAARDQR